MDQPIRSHIIKYHTASTMFKGNIKSLIDSLISTGWNELAFSPDSNIIDSFIDLTDNDDLPQELVPHSETHHTGAGRGLHGLEGTQ